MKVVFFKFLRCKWIHFSNLFRWNTVVVCDCVIEREIKLIEKKYGIKIK